MAVEAQGFAKQATLKDSVAVSGVGLHSGTKTTVELSPAPADTGIVFKSKGVSIPALVEHVIGTRRGTTLGVGDVAVHTVEHLLSAFRGLGVDNAFVDVDGEEIPAMDGSAWAYIEAIGKAGVKIQENAVRPILEYARKESFVATIGLSSYKVLPWDAFKVSVSISFPGTLIGVQELEHCANGSYPSEIGRARTFCLESEVDELRRAGLAKGGSLDNTIVVGSQAVKVNEPLRYKDEFVRHKILDFFGDISLIGPGEYRFSCFAMAPSHKSNTEFIRRLREHLTRRLP
ncbi:MAG: UDP-3-O-[3-hydroxymyristoyl] N-acetylglucosamine deacetylase [Elusimicrobia bacterium]|nr:UDP-3-O-[3-hydroxymyristoyl] N-acetylglucosamine deacetylase [Elusimicrobiota bacterium]